MNSPLSMVVADAAVRERVLDPTQSFIVQAPAGSGKTELLIQRFLALLATVEHPESVLAITFTRKAASEMRNRILEALEGATRPSDDDRPHKQQTWQLARRVLDRDRAFGWHLLEDPSRLEIRTVDSFCDSLARRIPVTSGFGAAFDLATDADPLYDEAARRTIDLLGSQDQRQWQAVAALLGHLDNDLHNLQRMIASMLARREQWLRIIGRSDRASEADLDEIRRTLEGALQDAIRYELNELRRAFKATASSPLTNELLSLARFAASQVDEGHPVRALVALNDLPGTNPECIPHWHGLWKFLFDTSGKLRGTLTVRNGFPRTYPQLKEQCLNLFADLGRDATGIRRLCVAFERLTKLPPATYSDSQWVFIRSLLIVLPLAVAHLKQVFSEEGRVDFSEVAQAALAALGTPEHPTDLGLSLGEKIQHVLVDEFQDTSVLQVALLERLTASWEPGGGNTLFLVGDPMQSIYGFREAEVTLFSRIQELGIGEHALDFQQLSSNFRSQQRLVQWFNSVFPHVLSVRNDVIGAVEYAPASAIRPPLDCDVQLHGFGGRDDAREAENVAALVQQAIAADHRSVAILVRARTHLPAIIKALQAADIRFRAVDIDPLASRQAVLDLDSLTRALLHLADRTAWLSVLRAPWCGLELADLWTLCRDNEYSPVLDLLRNRLPQLSAAGRPRAERLLSVVEHALRLRGRMPLRTLIESTWISLGGPAALRPGEVGEAELRDIRAYLDLVQRCASGGDLPDRPVFEQRLAKLFSPVDTTDDIRVEIMSIHQAKGLEFDTVIVPGLGRKTSGEDKRLLYWRERPIDGRVQLLIAPIEQIASKAEQTIEGYLRQVQKDRTAEETKRLLYVACTRAKRALHLLGHVDEAGAPEPGSLLQTLMLAPQVREYYSRVPFQQQSTATSTRATPVLHRIAADWQPPSAPEPLGWHGRTASSSTEADAPAHTYHWVGDTLRHIGTVVHAFLHRLAAGGLDGWNAHAIRVARPAIQAALTMQGVQEQALQSATEKVISALDATLADERGRWILARHEQAQNEFALSFVEDGRPRRVRLDRTFVDSDGVRWIIDYKTTHTDSTSVDSWADREAAKYTRDMERYAEVMRKYENRPVRAGLYFPLLKRWREVRLD